MIINNSNYFRIYLYCSNNYLIFLICFSIKIEFNKFQCSTECGKGIESRRVACSEGSELFCDPKEKPETERQCFGSGMNCDDAKWFTGPWTSVSKRYYLSVTYF